MIRADDFRIIGWGLWHDGTWYVNFFNNGIYDGIECRTLKECMKKLGFTKKAELGKFRRYDLNGR